MTHAGGAVATQTRDLRHAVTVDEVRDEAAFHALADRWNAAAQRAPQTSAFLSHEWFAAAWAWRRETASLSLLTSGDAARIDAVLPLVRPFATPRRLELLTVPDTQLADIVGGDDVAAAAADRFAAFLADRRDWDRLHLDYLRPDGPIVRHLVPALHRHRVLTDARPRGRNPFIALDVAWADYFATRSRRLKKALNLAGNRLHKSGAIRIDCIDATADDATFARALDAAIAISAASWKSRTGNSLDNAGPQAFIRTLSSAARKRGWLSIWLLSLDGRPLAMEYQLVSHGNVHALRSDFRADCGDLSPGTHLFRQLLEALFGRGHSRYYLGPGDNPYKSRWTEDGALLVRVHAYNRTLRGRLGWLVDVVAKPPLRRLREWWQDRPQRGVVEADE